MMRRRHRLVLLAALAAGASCAHARSPTGAAEPPPTWPPPPAPPLVRWHASFPDPGRPVERPGSFWPRAFRFVVGLPDAPGTAGPPLARPFGIAAAGGQIVVADPDGRQVVRIDWRTGTMAPVACEGRPWLMPMAVAVAPDGAIYVADGGAGAIVRRGARGDCTLIGAGTLERPTGVALAAGRIYAVDPPRHLVVGFGPDGREAVRFGTRGDGPGALNFPTALAVAPDGHLLVVDALNFRVSEFYPDGQYAGSFGDAGDGGGAFGRPKAVAVDRAGRIYVSDVQHDVVLRFDRRGTFQVAVGGGGEGPGQLTLPAGLAVDGDLLFVADSQGGRLEVYDLLGASP